MKTCILSLALGITALSSYSQTQPAMKWFNKPSKSAMMGSAVKMTVDPKTDYWRVTHYGFIRDNGPFYYQEQEGDFEASVKITGQYKELFHQAGLMVRIDEKNWIKTGIEYVDGVQNVSAVVTREVSDWSVVPRTDSPKSIWLKLLRKGDYVEIKYSFDGGDYKMLRLAYFPPQVKAAIGMVAAATGEKSFDVLFEDFKVSPVK